MVPDFSFRCCDVCRRPPLVTKGQTTFSFRPLSSEDVPSFVRVLQLQHTHIHIHNTHKHANRHKILHLFSQSGTLFRTVEKFVANKKSGSCFAANLFHFYNCNMHTNKRPNLQKISLLKGVVLPQSYLISTLSPRSYLSWVKNILWPQVYLAFSGKVQHLETNIQRQMSL